MDQTSKEVCILPCLAVQGKNQWTQARQQFGNAVIAIPDPDFEFLSDTAGKGGTSSSGGKSKRQIVAFYAGRYDKRTFFLAVGNIAENAAIGAACGHSGIDLPVPRGGKDKRSPVAIFGEKGTFLQNNTRIFSQMLTVWCRIRIHHKDLERRSLEQGFKFSNPYGTRPHDEASTCGKIHENGIVLHGFLSVVCNFANFWEGGRVRFPDRLTDCSEAFDGGRVSDESLWSLPVPSKCCICLMDSFQYGFGKIMIRSFREEDTEKIVAIWLAASIQAHDFIDRQYWENRVHDMRTLYLPLCDTIVYVDDLSGEPEGFMAFVDDFLAALFVSPDCQGRGIGTRLLGLAKKIQPNMELTVYAGNVRARAFYERHGFRVVSERLEMATGQRELVMRRGL